MNIVALSSDYRDFYIADIYRSLSLPSGSLLHFRYKKKYVDDVFFEKKSHIGKERIIIFLQIGNNNLDSYIKTNVPIRSGIIESFHYEENTEVFHIYIKLGEYVQYKKEHTLKEASGKYLYETQEDLVEQTSWHNVIETIKNTNLNIPDFFFCIKRVIRNNKTILPKIDPVNFMSYYKLDHDMKYSIEISIAKKDNSNSSLFLEWDKDILQLNSPSIINTSVQYDDINIPLETNQISRKAKDTFIEITPTEKENKPLPLYTSTISITLTKKLLEAIKFSTCTTFLIIALGLAKHASDIFSQNEICFISECKKDIVPSVFYSSLLLFISLILIFLITMYSYYKFNKK